MALIVIYTLWAGLPDQTMTAVADYEDLSGECLTDAHAALGAGLAIMVRPGMTTREEYDAGDQSPDTPFLQRYAEAVLEHSFVAQADRDWLLKKGLIQLKDVEAR